MPWTLIPSLLVGVALLHAAWVVVRTARRREEPRGEVAVVLGSPLRDQRPGPAFQGRLDHGADLYKAGHVHTIFVAGGLEQLHGIAESVSGARYLESVGVPGEAIVCDAVSTNTFENLLEARREANKRGWGEMVLVTDPLHMGRAATMARHLALEVRLSPTPYAHPVSWDGKLVFGMRECVGLLFHHVLWRIHGDPDRA